MFNIETRNADTMRAETDRLLNKIEGIEKFYDQTMKLYGNNFLCWGDDQIDELAYYPSEDMLTVRIRSAGRNIKIDSFEVTAAFWMMDFYDVEISYFDISPEHWIDELYIQENPDGKYSITFGAGNLDFRYSHAKVNRCWIEKVDKGGSL